MQEEKLRLHALRVGALPILNQFIARMGLADELTLALKNAHYAEALLALVKNILVDRNALYAVGEWAALYDAGLVAQAKIGDDRLGRALDRLFATDRATLQTRIVLAVIKGFDLKMDQIHNDTTSVTVSGAYDGQNRKAVQLKRGHNKDGRPDLKQLVYSLCVTADGAVPVHFKAYDGNQTDDGVHLETWNRLRTLLRHPRFIYVADCKLCTEKNLRTIDSEHGFFVTVVPKTRSEVATFTDVVLAGDVRWEEILRKRADRDEKTFDVIECAVGPYHLREGFMLYWFRSSQKKKRDARDRDEWIARTIERLESLDLRRMRGPKTDAAIRKRVDEIIAQHRTEEWIRVEVKWDAVEKFKAITRGKPTAETPDHSTRAEAICDHQRGKHCAIGGYGRDLPADNQHQGVTRRRVQDLQVPTQDREATCAFEIHARGRADLVEEKRPYRGLDVPRVHCADGRRTHRASLAPKNG